jgi:phosphotransacetylase
LPLPYLIGNPQDIQQQLDMLGLEYEPEIVDNNKFDRSSKYAMAYYELRNRKGVTMMDAVKKSASRTCSGR